MTMTVDLPGLAHLGRWLAAGLIVTWLLCFALGYVAGYVGRGTAITATQTALKSQLDGLEGVAYHLRAADSLLCRAPGFPRVLEIR